MGYEVITRTSSIETQELFLANIDQFDLIITDMTLPKKLGDEIGKELMNTEEKVMAVGIKDFVVKPVLMSEIDKTIRSCWIKK